MINVPAKVPTAQLRGGGGQVTVVGNVDNLQQQQQQINASDLNMSDIDRLINMGGQGGPAPQQTPGGQGPGQQPQGDYLPFHEMVVANTPAPGSMQNVMTCKYFFYKIGIFEKMSIRPIQFLKLILGLSYNKNGFGKFFCQSAQAPKIGHFCKLGFPNDFYYCTLL